MQACQTLFYLQKWFIIGYKHYRTLYWSFYKVAKLFAKESTYKPFLNHSILLCGGEMLLIRQQSIGFTKYVFKS